MTVRDGGCQCGAVRYRFTGAPQTLYLCHCRECQKQASSAFGMSLWVARETFEIVTGAPKFWTRSADSGRQMVCAFCGDCGSRLFHAEAPDSEIVSLKAGTLDDISWLRPVGQLWTRSAQPWVPVAAITDGPAHDTEPDSFDDLCARYRARGA